MCSVSMIGQHYDDMWRQLPFYPKPQPGGGVSIIKVGPEVTRAEFDELTRQVTEMKELLKRAKKYDEDNGQPDCEIDDKMERLRQIATIVGINLDEVLQKAAK